jgi:hypothetical protein
MCASSWVKPAHAHEAVQNAAAFEPVDGAEFGVAERQFPVGVEGGFVNQDVARAVHGFEEELLVSKSMAGYMLSR